MKARSERQEQFHPMLSHSSMQHSTLTIGGHYPLSEPDFHRLSRASFTWRMRTVSNGALSCLLVPSMDL
jgi:hypothetical protein